MVVHCVKEEQHRKQVAVAVRAIPLSSATSRIREHYMPDPTPRYAYSAFHRKRSNIMAKPFPFDRPTSPRCSITVHLFSCFLGPLGLSEHPPGSSGSTANRVPAYCGYRNSSVGLGRDGGCRCQGSLGRSTQSDVGFHRSRRCVGYSQVGIHDDGCIICSSCKKVSYDNCDEGHLGDCGSIVRQCIDVLCFSGCKGVISRVQCHSGCGGSYWAGVVACQNGICRCNGSTGRVAGRHPSRPGRIVSGPCAVMRERVIMVRPPCTCRVIPSRASVHGPGGRNIH